MSLAVVGGVQPEESGDHLSSPSLLRHRPRHCPLLLLLRSQGDQKHYLLQHLIFVEADPGVRAGCGPGHHPLFGNNPVKIFKNLSFLKF